MPLFCTIAIFLFVFLNINKPFSWELIFAKLRLTIKTLQSLPGFLLGLLRRPCCVYSVLVSYRCRGRVGTASKFWAENVQQPVFLLHCYPAAAADDDDNAWFCLLTDNTACIIHSDVCTAVRLHILLHMLVLLLQSYYRYLTRWTKAHRIWRSV